MNSVFSSRTKVAMTTAAIFIVSCGNKRDAKCLPLTTAQHASIHVRNAPKAQAIEHLYVWPPQELCDVFVRGDRSKGTTTLKLKFRPILKMPGCTPAGTSGLSKYFNRLMFDW